MAIIRYLSACLATVFLLAACETSEGYRQRMAMMYGLHADDLLIDWGLPDEKTELSDGRKLWIYNRIEESQGGGYYDREYYDRVVRYEDEDGKVRSRTVTESHPVWIPPYTVRTKCNTHFVFSKEMRIEDVSFHGNACIAREMN